MVARRASLLVLAVLLPPFLGTKAKAQTSETSTLQALRISELVVVDGRLGEDAWGLAHRLYFSYPNDMVEFSGSWARADDTFNPEVGYVRRASF